MHSVARKFLNDVELGDEAMRAAVVEFMPASFAAVNRASKSFFEVERRYNYTTPKTFLELIKLYKSVLSKKRASTQEGMDRHALCKIRENRGTVAIKLPTG